MQKFEFAFDRLLAIRRKQETAAAAVQAAARTRWEAALARGHELRRQLQGLSDRLLLSVGQTVAAHQWGAGFDHSGHLSLAIQEADRLTAQADDEHREAVRKRAEIAAEIEALQTLRAQQYEEHRQAVAKVEQERIDEAGLRLRDRHSEGQP